MSKKEYSEITRGYFKAVKHRQIEEPSDLTCMNICVDNSVGSLLTTYVTVKLRSESVQIATIFLILVRSCILY